MYQNGTQNKKIWISILIFLNLWVGSRNDFTSKLHRSQLSLHKAHHIWLLQQLVLLHSKENKLQVVHQLNYTLKSFTYFWIINFQCWKLKYNLITCHILSFMKLLNFCYWTLVRKLFHTRSVFWLLIGFSQMY